MFLNNNKQSKMESQSLFTRITGKNVLMSFTGPFDTEVLSIFGKNIENSISKNLKLNKT